MHQLLLPRAAAHYGAAWFFMGIYGTQVCPFIDSLSPQQIALPMAIALTLVFGLRAWGMDLIHRHCGPKQLIRYIFWSEWGLLVGTGVVLAAYNSGIYAFPLESGLKIILGYSTLGLFSALDLSLRQERDLGRRLQREGIEITPDSDYFPLAAKFAAFATLTIAMLTAIFFLLINKDLHWLSQIPSVDELGGAQRAIIIEFGFVATVLLAYTLLTIWGYATNLRQFFHHENQTLAAATGGDLSVAVTVSSND